MILLVAALVQMQPGSAAAVHAAESSLRTFGVRKPGHAAHASFGLARTWSIQFDRGEHSVFEVNLDSHLKLRGISWSSTSGDYRAPRPKRWALPDRTSARKRLDRMANLIRGRFPIRWEGYYYDDRKPGNLAFRAGAYRHLSVGGYPFLFPMKGYSLTISPIDGELRHVWIDDDLPPVEQGPPKVSADQARELIRKAAGSQAVARGWDVADLGYYVLPKETRARLVWRLRRLAPRLPLTTKSRMYFEVDYVDAIDGRYYHKSHPDSGELWDAVRSMPR
ncbi:MAG: hypothetical protein ACHQ50_05720 [Fimbriimonadales bacterium]